MISLTFDIFKVPNFSIPSLNNSYIFSMGIFILTIFQAYLHKLFIMCLSHPIFNMANVTPGHGERRFMRVFSFFRCVCVWGACVQPRMLSGIN